MGYISDSGTGSAAPTEGSAASMQPHGAPRGAVFMRRLGAALTLVALATGAAPTGSLDVRIDRLRSAKGVLRICLTADPKNFPGCVDDAHAITRSVPASERDVHFAGLPYGQYAVAVIHDANNNAKLDTLLGIPREGFGFSRNPAIHFGPPRFRSAEFGIESSPVTQTIEMRYFL